MFKKLLPFVVMFLVTACAGTQEPATGKMCMKMPCCEQCEMCKSGKCGECCKAGKCQCCKGGEGKMCMKGKKASASEEEQCPECAKAEREWNAKHQSMNHQSMKH